MCFCQAVNFYVAVFFKLKKKKIHITFIEKLNNILLCITNDLPYTAANEELVKLILDDLLPTDVEHFLFGVRGQLIVRLIEFADERATNISFQSTRDHSFKLRAEIWITHFISESQPRHNSNGLLMNLQKFEMIYFKMVVMAFNGFWLLTS
ncbi:hypothetical protein RchiOBHm_Chr5g0005951 [Rosa chinensis]|uniref:Uncharacterized protein n=1 Tax=Rosa chinensis TaxID=74649 RepID=A0A2P6Q3E9_ROSCH|nr:hypothetical protein RchiOBHm_Chr5g0005951 [Rosa chinensis]